PFEIVGAGEGIDGREDIFDKFLCPAEFLENLDIRLGSRMVVVGVDKAAAAEKKGRFVNSWFHLRGQGGHETAKARAHHAELFRIDFWPRFQPRGRAPAVKYSLPDRVHRSWNIGRK